MGCHGFAAAGQPETRIHLRRQCVATLALALVQLPRQYPRFSPNSFDETWAPLHHWIEDGVLLPQVTFASKAATQEAPRRLVNLSNIVGKRCLLQEIERNCMFVVRLQNSLEELYEHD